MNDHAILIGWVGIAERTDKGKEMKTMDEPTIRPTDKGATRKLERIFSRISGE